MPQSGYDSTDLPALVPRTHCVLIPRDPNFIYAYWDYSEEDINRARNQLQFEGVDFQLILRVYDITLIKFNGSNAKHTWDLEAGFSTKNWYIHVWQDNADYCAELGLHGPENHFIPLARSNMVHTPPKFASKRDDLIWQDIKAHRESRPYIKENIRDRYQGIHQRLLRKKSHEAKRPGRTYYLTAQDIRAYYMKLFYGVSKKRREDLLKRKLRSGSWQKVRPFITSPDLLTGASESLSSSHCQKC